MAQRVTNKVAIATGGDGGMGAATACRVWKEGARVGVVVKTSRLLTPLRATSILTANES